MRNASTSLRKALLVGVLAGALAGQARAQNYDYIVTPLLALSNVAQTAKDAPGALLYYSCVNPNAAQVWLQIYDTTGAVTVGTTAPTLSLPVASSSSTGPVQPTPSGARFMSSGIQAAITTTKTGGSAPSSPVPCDIAHR